MAKIAVKLAAAVAQRLEAGTPGRTTPRLLASGPGWTVQDVICTSGPHDRAFEERHSGFSIAIVTGGTFQYRSSTRSSACSGRSRRELMTPGSLMLGSPGQCFECGHEHGVGDRCISFWFDPDFFGHIAGSRAHFSILRLPAMREFSPLAVRALAALADSEEANWEEIGIALAAKAVQLSAGMPESDFDAALSAEARITRALRRIEHDSELHVSLRDLAAEARLSLYHFLRVFETMTGLTPHQYLRRARLRKAAARLLGGQERILDVALGSGFGDVSNFNRAFRAEFGISPRLFRNLKTR